MPKTIFDRKTFQRLYFSVFNKHHILDLQYGKKNNGVSTKKVPGTLFKLPFTVKIKMVRRNITRDFFINEVPLLVVLA